MAIQTYLATTLAAALLVAAPIDDMTGGPAGNPSMAVNPDPLTAGGSATVTYSDPSQANQSIVVDIDNGMQRGTQTSTLVIELDEHGEGSAVWEVPTTWFLANFNAPNVAEIGCMISHN